MNDVGRHQTPADVPLEALDAQLGRRHAHSIASSGAESRRLPSNVKELAVVRIAGLASGQPREEGAMQYSRISADCHIDMPWIPNDWLKDFCRHYPDRQIGLACLPYGDIDAAVQEVRRVAKMGLKGIELSCSWDMEPMWHPVWEPLWRAVNEVNLPLHFHTFPS